jgi:hypothetical protein
MGAGRINTHYLREASFFDQVAKNAFSTGGAANVTRAYEKNFCHHGAYCAGKPLTCLEIFSANQKKIVRKGKKLISMYFNMLRHDY